MVIDGMKLLQSGMKTALFALVSATFLLVAPQAHADDQGYMNYLAAHGVPPWPAGPGLKAGHDACNALRDGSPPQSFIGTMGLMGQMYGQTVIDGAHQYLCPGA